MVPGDLAQQLAEIGVRLALVVLDDAAYFDLLEHAGASLWVGRLGCLTGDASEFLDLVVHSQDPGGHFGSANYGDYQNPELDAAIEECASFSDSVQRRQALQAVSRAVSRERVWIPLFREQDGYAFVSALEWQPRADALIRAIDISWAP